MSDCCATEARNCQKRILLPGLSPAEVITTVTRNAAYVFSPRPDIGLIKLGYRADLLVLNSDPLTDVRNIVDIVAIWAKGQAYMAHDLIKPSPEAVVQNQVDYYNDRDLAGFMSTYAEDIEVYDLPFGGKPRIAGSEAFMTYYGKAFRKYPDGYCHIVQRIALGNYVIDREYCRFDSESAPVRVVAVYDIENSLIRRVWFAR